ncbi:MAG: Crp/Fnr family transcriptional regulator [Nitrospirae bacterium]|nr:Crp/Fnr family transcriptional regulator [Nitrospirota bacterium]
MARYELLRKIPIFNSFLDAELRKVADHFQEERFDRHEYIFMEGDPSEWLCIVAEGEVRIVKHSPNGKDMTLEIIAPGEVFGAVAVFDQIPYPASAQALQKTTVLKLPRRVFFDLLDRHPAMAVDTITFLGKRLRAAHAMMRALAADRVERRIAAILLKLAEKAGVPEREGVRIGLPLTRQDVAEMVGTTVETAIRVMSKFTKAGWIASEEGSILIRNRAKLAEICGESLSA